MTVLFSNIAREFPLTGLVTDKGPATAQTQRSDVRLWEDLRNGSETAFSTIYDEYADELYGYGMKLFPHQETIKDAIQDLFVSLWSSRNNLSRIRSIRAYLYISFRRKVLFKAAERRKLILLDHGHACFQVREVVSSDQEWINQEQTQKDLHLLNNALSKLTDRQREIIYLRFHAMMDYSEIARIMSTDKKAAYNLMARTLARLKKLMAGTVALLIMDLLSLL